MKQHYEQFPVVIWNLIEIDYSDLNPYKLVFHSTHTEQNRLQIQNILM